MLTKPKDYDIFLSKFNQIEEIAFSKIEKNDENEDISWQKSELCYPNKMIHR